jgi:hypothetical protein
VAARGIPTSWCEEKVHPTRQRIAAAATAVAPVDAKHRRATRAIVVGADKRAREESLPLDIHSGTWQIGVRRRPIIAQKMQHRRLIATVGKGGGQTALGVLHLGPRRIEQIVRQSIDARTELAPLAAHALVDTKTLAIAHDDVEGIESGTHRVEMA